MFLSSWIYYEETGACRFIGDWEFYYFSLILLMRFYTSLVREPFTIRWLRLFSCPWGSLLVLKAGGPWKLSSSSICYLCTLGKLGWPSPSPTSRANVFTEFRLISDAAPYCCLMLTWDLRAVSFNFYCWIKLKMFECDREEDLLLPLSFDCILIPSFW